MSNIFLIILLLNGIIFVKANNISERNHSKITSWEDIKEDHIKSALMSAKGILFVMCCLFAGVAIHFGSKKYHYPYTVGCFLFGIFIGLMEIHSTFVQDYTLVTRMNPSDMMLVFLPILIFESSFGMDAHMFYKALPQCLTLAGLGFLFCTIATAAYVKLMLQSYEWSWLTALVFGSIVSATDPVAVVALLKEMRMPHSFTILIEGESLLNDGVAIVLYEVLTHQVASEAPFMFGTTAIQLLKTCIGAPVFGYIFGKITEWILIQIYISPVSEMTMNLALVYVTYFVAERFLGISAVLAVVLYGVTLNANKMCISPDSESLIHTDWRLLSVYANTLIFMIVGILVTVSFSQHFDQLDLWLILVTYIFLTLLRTTMVVICYPLLRKIGYDLNWKEIVILSWGGLRGAIGLSLALMFASNPHFPSYVNASKVLIQVSGIIVLTLIVNANTVKCILKKIKFKQVTLVNRLSMGNAIACVTGVKEKSLRICKGDWRLKKADWEWVINRACLNDPYEGGLYGDDPTMSSLFIPYGTCDECLTTVFPYTPSSEEMNELKEATRKKVLSALKGNLWKQFRKGLLQRRSLKALCVAVDNVSDVPHKYLKTEDVERKLMKVSSLNQWLETRLSYVMKKFRRENVTNFDLNIYHLRKSPNGSFRSWCAWFYFSWWLTPLMCLIIILNAIHVVTDVYMIMYPEVKMHEKHMENLAVLFILLYIGELIIKISTLQWNCYIKCHWNKLDFILTCLAVLEGIIDLILFHYPALHSLFTHVRILILLRLLRYLNIVKCILCILSLLRSQASSELYYAYDIGRGFLFATEAVLKNIDMIVDFGPCAKIPIFVCEKNIKKMLDVLDEFEKNYPSVALALKSNRTARRILNRVKIVLDHLKKKSFILQEDAIEMKSILFKMTKMIMYAPRARPTIGNIQKILEEVYWISPELVRDINENHSIITFKTGDIIQEEGHNHEFVYIIAKGIVKIVGEKSEQQSPDMAYTKLPNVDSLLFFQDFGDRTFFDYLTRTQTIGLLGYLQRTPVVTTAICEKECELIQMEYSFLKEAQEKYDNMLYCMWKNIAINISVHLLKRERRYKNYTEEDINLRLQKGILPDLTEVTSIAIPTVVEDLVIIQGRVKNIATEVDIIAPSYIPSTCRSLHFLDEVKKRPLVIMLLLLDSKYDLHTSTHFIKPDEISEIAGLF